VSARSRTRCEVLFEYLNILAHLDRHTIKEQILHYIESTTDDIITIIDDVFNASMTMMTIDDGPVDRAEFVRHHRSGSAAQKS
jgi:hypothetical protein